jgi:hypothetical protein
MSIEETEAASAAVVKIPANRVSLADIEANIAWETCRSAAVLLPPTLPHDQAGVVADIALSSLTICVIVLRNGFTVIGKSAPADPANFNAELGRKFAREDAIRQIWPLMGYAKRQELAGAG